MTNHPESRLARFQEVLGVLKNPSSFKMNSIRPMIRAHKIPFDRIAWAVVYSEEEARNQTEMLSAIRSGKNKAVQKEKDAADKMARQIRRIEDVTDTKFSDLPEDMRLRSFYKRGLKNGIDGNVAIREYAAAHIRKTLETTKALRWGGSATKPIEKGLIRFCRAMRLIFEEKALRKQAELERLEQGARKAEKNALEKEHYRIAAEERAKADKAADELAKARKLGTKIDYRLIASIANLFGLSARRQTYDTIKKHFSRGI